MKIKWNGDYSHNFADHYSPENKYKSGLSQFFQNGSPEERGRIQKDGYLLAELILPKGTSGPLPFVILMHGCSGLTPLVARWAKEKAINFLKEGYGVLVLDSFKSRNVTDVCGQGNYHWGWRRSEDAYSALAYLVENKFAVPNKVYVMGRSNGGTAAIMIASYEQVIDHQFKFEATFAVSPGCAGLAKRNFGIPLIIFIGEKDQANDPSVCDELSRTSRGSPVQMYEFANVAHGYEDNAPPMRSMGGAWNTTQKLIARQ
ncbi:dienelactone hydrolase [Nitrobacteraceae bacterium AZCC 2146]